eukprot:scaffold106770_cov37-Tisochrysis_lutea.AAC.2
MPRPPARWRWGPRARKPNERSALRPFRCPLDPRPGGALTASQCGLQISNFNPTPFGLAVPTA